MKYYTPSIEEFYIGFEFQINNDPRGDFWENAIIENYHDLQYTTNPKSDGEYRVKYLDQTDIEELGWESCKGDVDVYHIAGTSNNQFCKGDYSLTKLHKLILIRLKVHDSYIQVFRGVVKNKSELKKCMKMLNIT